MEKLTEIQHGKTQLEEDYLYRCLPTLTERDKRQRKGRIVIACLDEKLTDSLLSFSIAGLVAVENEQADAVINSYLKGKESRSHAYVFHHRERCIVVCIEFSGGDMAIDKIKQQSVDSMSITRKRFLQIEELPLIEGFSVKGE